MYGDDAYALVIFSPSPQLGIWGCHWSSVDGQRSGKLDKRSKSDDVNSIRFAANSYVCVLVCVALPMVVGVWSMGGELWQLFEY